MKWVCCVQQGLALLGAREGPPGSQAHACPYSERALVLGGAASYMLRPSFLLQEWEGRGAGSLPPQAVCRMLHLASANLLGVLAGCAAHIPKACVYPPFHCTHLQSKYFGTSQRLKKKKITTQNQHNCVVLPNPLFLTHKS